MLNRQTDAIAKLTPLKTFKQLKSCMGSIHHLTRYISKPSKEASALKPLLKTLDKDKTLDWKSDHTTAFYRILKLVSEITENKQFDQNLETRVVCDASKLE